MSSEGLVTLALINENWSSSRRPFANRNRFVWFQSDPSIDSRIWFGKSHRTAFCRYLVRSPLDFQWRRVFVASESESFLYFSLSSGCMTPRCSALHICFIVCFVVVVVVVVVVVTSGLSPAELACPASFGSRGWVSTDHLSWVIGALNRAQEDALVICPDMVVDIGQEMKRQAHNFSFGSLQRMVFVLNVGRNKEGVFAGNFRNPGRHWVLVVAELGRPWKKIIYCDSLAWEAPRNLLKLVNSYTTHMSIGTFTRKDVLLAHNPVATDVYGHSCDKLPELFTADMLKNLRGSHRHQCSSSGLRCPSFQASGHSNHGWWKSVSATSRR